MSSVSHMALSVCQCHVNRSSCDVPDRSFTLMVLARPSHGPWAEPDTRGAGKLNATVLRGFGCFIDIHKPTVHQISFHFPCSLSVLFLLLNSSSSLPGCSRHSLSSIVVLLHKFLTSTITIVLLPLRSIQIIFQNARSSLHFLRCRRPGCRVGRHAHDQ